MSALGVRLVLRDVVTADDLGTCTVPGPVEIGDLVALEHGPPLRVVDVLPVPAGSPCVPVLVRLAAIRVVAR
jgi:hypothetical protein